MVTDYRGFNGLLGYVAPLISGDYDKPRLGTNVAFLWGALNVGCWAYVYFFIPELKGLQLEQVDELYVSL
jgi:MFS transporter, SP family, sugar:H+ symporter